MDIIDTMLFYMVLQVILAKFWTVHTHRILSNIN